MHKPSNIQYILIRLPNWLGDMVMATAFVQAVQQKYPGVQVDLIAKKGLDFLLDYFPPHGDKLVFDKKAYPGLLGAWRFGKQIAAQKKYDLFFCLPNSFSSAVMARATGATHTIGYQKELRSFLLSRSYPIPTQRHRVEEYMGLLQQYSGNNNIVPPVRLQVSERHTNAICIINVNSEASSRRLPVEKAVELISAVRKSIAQPIVLIGSPAEQDFVTNVYAALPDKTAIENKAGQTTLPGLIELLASAPVMLTTDSGPAHVANALGVHTVVLFGAGNEQNTAPYNANKTIIRLGKLPCEPCINNVCKKFSQPRCLQLIEQSTVSEAVAYLLNKNA